MAPHLVPERNAILDFLAAVNKPRGLNKIAEALGVTSTEARAALERRLQAMQRDGQVIRNRREGYGLARKMDLLRGTVIGHPDGFGFLRLDAGGDDLYLSAREMRSLLHGDVILARVRGIDRRGRLCPAVAATGREGGSMFLGYFTEQPMSAYDEKEGLKYGATALTFSNKHFDPVEGSRL